MLRRERDWIILTGGIRDENEKIPDYGRLNTRRTATLTRRDRDKHSEWGGIAGLTQKGWQDSGLKKPILDPRPSEFNLMGRWSIGGCTPLFCKVYLKIISNNWYSLWIMKLRARYLVQESLKNSTQQLRQTVNRSCKTQNQSLTT